MAAASVLTGRLTRAIVASLTPELLKPQYQGITDRGKLVGHCYVASEALWHMLGGARSDWVPQVIRHEGGTHWYLKNSTTGRIVDLTKSQFRRPVPYENGRGAGFLTLRPSKRASVVIRRARARLRG